MIMEASLPHLLQSKTRPYLGVGMKINEIVVPQQCLLRKQRAIITSFIFIKGGVYVPEDATLCSILSIQDVCECLSTSTFMLAIVSLNATLSWVSQLPANSSTLERLSASKKSAGYLSSQNFNSLNTLLHEERQAAHTKGTLNP